MTLTQGPGQDLQAPEPPRGRSGAVGWWPVMILVVAVLAAGWWWWSGSGRPGRLARGFDGLAGAMPAEAQFFLVLDVTDQVKMEDLAGRLETLRQSNPTVASRLEQVEKSLGVSLKSIGKWAEPSLALALMPRTGQKGMTPGPGGKVRPLDIVLVAPVRDPAVAQADLEALWHKHGKGEPRVTKEMGVTIHSVGDGEAEVSCTLSERCLVVGSGVEAVTRTLRVMNHGAPSLAGKAEYVEARKKVAGRQGLLVWVAVADMLGPLAAMPAAQGVVDDQTRLAIEAIRYKVGCFEVTPSGLDLQVFARIDAASKSDFVKALLEAQSVSRSLTRYIPAKWGNCVSFNGVWAGSVLYQAGLLFPASRARLSALPLMMLGTLGFNPAVEFQKVSKGEVVYGTNYYSELARTLPAFLAGSGMPPQPTQVFVIALTDVEAGKKLIGQFEDKANVKSQVVKSLPEQGTEMRGYGALPLRWAVISQPERILFLAVGPQAQERLEEALKTGATSSEGVEKVSAMQALLGETSGKVILASYTDMTPLTRALTEGLKSLPARVPVEVRETLAVLGDGLKSAGDVQGVSVLSVEPDGMRYRQKGMGGQALIGTTAVLAAILVPNFVRARSQGQMTACKSNLKNIGTALEMWSTDHQGRFPESLSQLTPDYLKRIPTCPKAGQDTYSASYQHAAGPDAYTVFCSGHGHKPIAPANYPQYTSTQGLVIP